MKQHFTPARIVCASLIIGVPAVILWINSLRRRNFIRKER